MNLQGRLSAPDGPLRKSRRQLHISAPEKKKSSQLDASSNAPERHGGTMEDQDTILQHIAFPSTFISS